jgi:hypothetical protein
VRLISKNDLTVQREITQNFRSHKILQEVVLNPPNEVVISYLKGLTEGKKTMIIEKVSEEIQILRVLWQIRFSGIYRFATPLIKRHTVRGTEHALERIKAAAEAMSEQAKGLN